MRKKEIENEKMKEKDNNIEFEPIEDDELDEVSGGGSGLNPPRVDIHPYDDEVKGRM